MLLSLTKHMSACMFHFCACLIFAAYLASERGIAGKVLENEKRNNKAFSTKNNWNLHIISFLNL